MQMKRSSLLLSNIVGIMEMRAAPWLALTLQHLAKMSDWPQNIPWFSRLYRRRLQSLVFSGLPQGTEGDGEVVDFNNVPIRVQCF